MLEGPIFERSTTIILEHEEQKYNDKVEVLKIENHL